MRATIIALTLALAGCSGLQPTDIGETIGPDHARAAGEFSTGTEMKIALAARQIRGEVALCGAWGRTQLSLGVSRIERDPLRGAVVRLGGVRVATDIVKLPRRRLPLDGRLGQCFLTGTGWQAGFDGQLPVIELPRVRGQIKGRRAEPITFQQVAP